MIGENGPELWVPDQAGTVVPLNGGGNQRVAVYQTINISPGLQGTVEAEVRQQLAGQTGLGGNTAAATLIGKRVAEKAKAAGIELVAFDRSGFRYHGRVKALADAAREAGLKF